MKVEYNGESRRSPKKTKKRKKRHLKPAFYIFLAMIVLGTLTALSLTVFFNVTGFELLGSSVYGADEITSRTGIAVGDNLLRINTEKAVSNIEASLPYVKTAKVSRKFPDKVKVEVTPAEEYAVVCIENAYYIVDSDFKVLAQTDGKREGLLYIKCSENVKAVPGTLLTFQESAEYEDLKEIIAYASSAEMGATVIDISSRVSMSVVLDNRLFVNFGSGTNLSRKLSFLSTMISSVTEGASAKIDLSSWSETNKKATLVYEDISDMLN